MSLLSRASGNDVDVFGMKDDRIRTSSEHSLISGRASQHCFQRPQLGSKVFEACQSARVTQRIARLTCWSAYLGGYREVEVLYLVLVGIQLMAILGPACLLGAS